jgi:hypothetical protein
MTSLALRTEVASPDNVTWHLDSITVTNDSTGETAEYVMMMVANEKRADGLLPKLFSVVCCSGLLVEFCTYVPGPHPVLQASHKPADCMTLTFAHGHCGSAGSLPPSGSLPPTRTPSPCTRQHLRSSTR